MEADKLNERTVAILMGTFNGEKYLREQLNSIKNQSHKNWRLYASDDGSSDGTISILETYQKYWGTDRLRITKGPQRGHAANFLSLVQDEEIQADYFAFCDQDDIWLEDKLERSIRSIQKFDESAPALYGSRTIHIDKDGKKIGISTLFRRPPSFKNALVQNIAGGNTMMFNKLTRKLFDSIPRNSSITAHDWITYVLVTACGGYVYYDTSPCLLYRQHLTNLIGSNLGFRGRLFRIFQLLKGEYSSHIDTNLKCLEAITRNADFDFDRDLEQFWKLRRGNFLSKIRILSSGLFYRQTILGNLGLFFAVITKKI